MPHTVASTIIPAARTSRGLGEALLKGIKPADFAREPKGVHTNHPAWVFGHLSIYPDWMLGMIGKPELAKPRDGFDKLFANPTESKDDPTGNIYPPMETITAHYFERMDAIIKAIAETDDAVFAQPNPSEAMKDRFPTVGAMVNFMLGSHCMMHLGQVSAWRRIMGLGSAM